MMVASRVFTQTLALLEQSGAGQRLEQLVTGSPRGRKRPLTCSVLFAGMVATSAAGQVLSLHNVHTTLTKSISKKLQRRHGLRSTTGETISVRQVRYLNHALATALTPDTDSATPHTVADEVLNLLLAASIGPNWPATQTFAMDGTGVEAYARPRHRTPSADPDARHGYQTETYDNKTSELFGYHATVTGTIPNPGKPSDDVPVLACAMVLRPANEHCATAGLDTIDQLARRTEITELIYDRAWSFLKPENWANHMRTRGIDTVFDYHPHDRGPLHSGEFILVDGGIYCATLPEHLINIERPPRFHINPPRKNATRGEQARYEKDKQQLDDFVAAIEQRQRYAFKPIATKSNPTGQRLTCPAVAGKIRCTARPESTLINLGTTIPTIDYSGQDLKGCSQETQTVPHQVNAKRQQKYPWGSRTWISRYNLRTKIEGYFGNLKSSKTTNVRRGWCFVMGIAKTGILLCSAMFATNLRLKARWQTRHPSTADTASQTANRATGAPVDISELEELPDLHPSGP